MKKKAKTKGKAKAKAKAKTRGAAKKRRKPSATKARPAAKKAGAVKSGADMFAPAPGPMSITEDPALRIAGAGPTGGAFPSKLGR